MESLKRDLGHVVQLRNVATAERRRVLAELCEELLRLSQDATGDEALTLLASLGVWLDRTFRGDDGAQGVN